MTFRDLSYLRVTDDPDIEAIYDGVRETLLELGAPPDMSAIDEESYFWIPPSVKPVWPPVWRVDLEIAYSLALVWSEQDLRHAFQIFENSKRSGQSLELAWCFEQRGRLYLHEEGGDLWVGFTHNGESLGEQAAMDLKTVAASWRATITPTDPETPVVAGGVSAAEVDVSPCSIEIRSLSSRTEALRLFDQARGALVAAKGPPGDFSYSVSGRTWEAPQLAETCSILGGEWSMSFFGPYEPQFDFDTCTFLPDGHYPLLSWQELGPDFHLRFQLALAKQDDSIELHAYSTDSMEFLESILDDFEYEQVE